MADFGPDIDLLAVGAHDHIALGDCEGSDIVGRGRKIPPNGERMPRPFREGGRTHRAGLLASGYSRGSGRLPILRTVTSYDLPDPLPGHGWDSAGLSPASLWPCGNPMQPYRC